MEKIAYSIQMSYPIPDSDKRVAEKASEHFNTLLSRLKLAVEHLDLLYNPFKKANNLNSSVVTEYRDVFRQYRDKVQSNFQKAIKIAYKGVSLMNEFSNSVTEDILKAFVSQMESLEEAVNIFLNIIDDFSSQDYKNNIILSIDSIKKNVNKARQIVNDRILEHIDTNILAKNWMSDLSNKHHVEVKERIPLVIELFRERQKALE